MRRLSEVLKEQYGEKVYKLSLTSGCTCPNRDGTVGFGGCAFCSEGGSGEFAAAPGEIDDQILEAKKRIRAKTDADHFIAYFQAFSNTYGDVRKLRPLYEKVIRREDIVSLSIATRPDCLGEDVMEMLKDLNGIKPVWVELGLQTIHESTAQRLNRGYELPVFEEACAKLKTAGIKVIVHVIMGLPGETTDDMLDTIRHISQMEYRPDGIKLQMLNILKGTRLEKAYREAPFPLLTLDEYADIVAESISILPDDMEIHRLTGDGPGDLLIAPDWVRNKKRVLNTINRRIKENGKRHG